jgi:uncharacterized protein with PIN domain
MAILDLDKIIFTKYSDGVRCNYCGGDLKKTIHPKLIGRVISFLTFGKIKTGHYQCENCKKRYTIL